MMEVYHTSNVRVECPDTLHSRRNLDFGPGFYFTSIREQAENYAARFRRQGEPAWLNIYDFDEDWSGWKVKSFNAYDDEWLDFVMQCREGEDVEEYDLVVGGIANDKVFDTIDLYFDGLISKTEALSRLAYEKPNIQFCIRTDAMLKKSITYKDSVLL